MTVIICLMTLDRVSSGSYKAIYVLSLELDWLYVSILYTCVFSYIHVFLSCQCLIVNTDIAQDS